VHGLPRPKPAWLFFPIFSEAPAMPAPHAYIDESGTDKESPVFTVAGLLYEKWQAKRLDRLWKKSLTQAGIGFFPGPPTETNGPSRFSVRYAPVRKVLESESVGRFCYVRCYVIAAAPRVNGGSAAPMVAALPRWRARPLARQGHLHSPGAGNRLSGADRTTSGVVNVRRSAVRPGPGNGRQPDCSYRGRDLPARGRGDATVASAGLSVETFVKIPG
jgi:hypothetical protein